MKYDRREEEREENQEKHVDDKEVAMKNGTGVTELWKIASNMRY